MTHCLQVVAISAVVVAVTSLVACSSDESGLSPPARDTPIALSEGGGPPHYSQPVVVVPGEYISPAGYPEARERGQQAETSEAGQPVFEGEINGVALRELVPKNFPDYCGDADFDRFDPTDTLDFDYLPPGTAVSTPQYAAVCPDGTQAVVGEEFEGYNFLFEVYFRTGDQILLHDAPVGRVSPIVIRGLPGVAVAPLTSDGYGSSRIAWVTPNGMLEVTASDLPFEEVQKIAEGVQCEKC